MHFLWNFFLERRAFTILTMVTLAIASVYALVAIPKEASPEVAIPQAFVSVALPGATASDVERLIVDKLEPSIRNIANVDTVTSTARPGSAVIVAEFTQDANLETAVQDVRNAIERERGELPTDATAPVVTKVDTADQPILILSVSSQLAPETLTKLGDDLEDALVTVDGVSKVDVSGVRVREIAIIVHKNALSTHNISTSQVIGAIQAANASAPAGTVTIEGVEYPVQFKGDITEVADIRDLPIATPSGEVKLSDIATIVNGYASASSISHLATADTELTYALTLNIYKSKGGSVLTVSEQVEEKLASLEDTLLKGSEALVTYDGAEEVRTNIVDLSTSGFQTLLLVMLVLFVAIGFREAIVAALAIPFSFMIAFIGMLATGNTINFLSLFSLIIAIGILVDSGIVVTEAIHTNREKGMRKMEAAKKAVHDFAWPLIAGTMTTVAVFFPLFFLSGIMGEYMKAIPFTIIVVLLASIVVSLGFVPSIALGLIRHEESKLAKYREKLWGRISRWYRAKMERLFRNKWTQRGFFAFLTFSFIFAFYLPFSGALKVIMFPAADMDFFYIEIELPTASTLAETERALAPIEEIIGNTPYVDSYTTTVGASSPFSASGMSTNANLANVTINLDKDRGSSHSSIDIAGDIREQLDALQTNAKITVTENVGGPPSGAPVAVKIWSDDTVKLAEATEIVERITEKMEGTRDTASSLESDATQLSIAIDRDKANEYGLSARDVANTLQTAIAGFEATTVRLGGDDVDVRVKLDLNEEFVNPEDTTLANADAIATVPISTARGIVPLGSFVAITAERSATIIRHEDGERLGQVSAYLAGDANPVEITNQIREKVESTELPEGVRVTYGGDTEDIQKTFTEMIVALVAGLVLMFAILVLEFDAFRTSLRLLAAIPLSLTGVLIGLWLMGQPISITAMLGIIALAGVIINHGILLLDDLNSRKRDNPDMGPEEVVLDSAQSRVRPILLTTITTVIGMMPLITISAMWAPLAFTIAFGLIYGTLLTLVFIPLLSYRYEVKCARKKAQQ